MEKGKSDELLAPIEFCFLTATIIPMKIFQFFRYLALLKRKPQTELQKLLTIQTKNDSAERHQCAG